VVLKYHINEPRDWDILIRNPFITLDFIERHIDKKWNWIWISQSISITPEFVEKHIDRPWSWRELAKNPSITPEFIQSYPEKDWNWACLSANPAITFEFIKKHVDKMHIMELSQNSFENDHRVRLLKIRIIETLRTSPIGCSFFFMLPRDLMDIIETYI
jgi:hypothetical protein